MTEFVHNVDLPQPGGSINTWGSELNSVFDSVLHKIAEFGPESEIRQGGRLEPGTDGLREDQLFVATDNNPNSIHRYDGASWELIFDGSASDIDGAIDVDGLSVSGWDVIDVSNHGFTGDETGGDIAQFILNNPDSVFYLPEGRYSWETSVNVWQNADWSRVAIIGQPHATLVLNNTDVTEFLHTGYDTTEIDRLHLQNLTFEVDGANGYDAGIIRGAANEFAYVHNVELSGQRRGYEHGGSTYAFRLNMLQNDSVGFVQNLRMMDGDAGEVSTNYDGVQGVGSEPPHKGKVFWQGCHIALWPDNGYYLKDGTGSHIVMGCSAHNCGNQMYRLGQSDYMIANESISDVDPATLDHDSGVHVEVELGEGTGVMGHRAVAEYTDWEIIRVRGGNVHGSLKDIWIENHTTQYGIRASSGSGTTETTPEAGDGKIVFDNCHVHQIGSPTDNIKAGQIGARRSNLVLRNCTVQCERDWHTAIVVQQGDVKAENCRFITTSTYSATIGDSSHGPLGTVQFDSCEFNGEINLNDDSNGNATYDIDYLEFVGCNFSGLTSSDDPFGYGMDPRDNANIDQFTFFRNYPFTESTDYGTIHQNEMQTEAFGASGLANLPYFVGADIQTSSNAEWYKIAHLSGNGANCKVLITENSRTGNTHETGIEFAAFKNGNDIGEHGGYWYQLAPPEGRIREGDFGYVETGDKEMDIYYKAAPFTQSSAIVLDGDGVTYDYQNVGTTEPTGIVYLDDRFPIASPLELANGINSDVDVTGQLSEGGQGVVTVLSAWDGTSLTLDADGDTIDFISE